MIPFGNKTFLLHEGDWYKLSEPVKLSGMDAVMQRVYSNAVFTALNIVKGADNVPWSITFRKGSVTVFTMPKKLIIRAPFSIGEIDGEPALCPAFNDRNSPELVVQWNPPTTMRLVFMAHFVTSGAEDYLCGYRIYQYFYLAQNISTGNAYSLHLGNLYDNGMICMGRGAPGMTREDSLVGHCDTMLKYFNDSPWNSDLRYNAEASKTMFSFKPGDKSQIFTDARWNHLARGPVSDMAYNDSLSAIKNGVK